MSFSEVMLCIGAVLIVNAVCLWACFVIPGWWLVKVLLTAGVNCVVMAILTVQ